MVVLHYKILCEILGGGAGRKINIMKWVAVNILIVSKHKTEDNSRQNQKGAIRDWGAVGLMFLGRRNVIDGDVEVRVLDIICAGS